MKTLVTKVFFPVKSYRDLGLGQLIGATILLVAQAFGATWHRALAVVITVAAMNFALAIMKKGRRIPRGLNSKERIKAEISLLREQIAPVTRQIGVLVDKLKKIERQELEATSAFILAKALFDQGWRLTNWGAQLTDTGEEIYLRKNGKDIGYWADGASRHTEDAFELIGLEDDEENDEVLYRLSDLTQEAGPPYRR